MTKGYGGKSLVWKSYVGRAPLRRNLPLEGHGGPADVAQHPGVAAAGRAAYVAKACVVKGDRAPLLSRRGTVTGRTALPGIGGRRGLDEPMLPRLTREPLR